jgi:hypothetical protein
MGRYSSYPSHAPDAGQIQDYDDDAPDVLSGAYEGGRSRLSNGTAQVVRGPGGYWLIHRTAHDEVSFGPFTNSAELSECKRILESE